RPRRGITTGRPPRFLSATPTAMARAGADIVTTIITGKRKTALVVLMDGPAARGLMKKLTKEMDMNKLIASALVSIGLAAAVPAVFAQTAGATDPAGAPAGQQHAERRPAMSMSERVEARLAYLRTALKITSAQQTQWDAYANVQRKHAA